jgi:DNA-directed RNA polymerase specialized sigma24 family protein
MDIAQETFLKLFSCMRDFRGEASFESWLYRLVVNRCLDPKRGAAPTVLVGGLLDLVRATVEGSCRGEELFNPGNAPMAWRR